MTAPATSRCRYCLELVRMKRPDEPSGTWTYLNLDGAPHVCEYAPEHKETA